MPAQAQMEPPHLDAELEVLAAAAVAVSGRKAYRRNRRAYCRWVREFSDGTVTGPEAVDELQDLVEEQRELVSDVWPCEPAPCWDRSRWACRPLR
ncbi:hypothetical protein [Actinoplanes sp. NPDC026623]|uniref:hypothetical protein n=1 Tax=Actinoplanes sp. NPDC026623 TaxID=3155610 RepID=UPI0033EB2425